MFDLLFILVTFIIGGILVHFNVDGGKMIILAILWGILCGVIRVNLLG